MLGDIQLLPDAFYHLSGTLSPTEIATQACGQAVDQLRAYGVTDCAEEDSQHGNILDTLFLDAQGLVQQVVRTVPLQNPVQAAVDRAAGTAAPGTPVVSSQPKPQATSNMLFLFGAILILAFGFLLVFR